MAVRPSQERRLGVDRATADEVRQVARELAAQRRETVTVAEAIRAAVAAWRQLTGANHA
jgi:CelD/BcsL family acetyltransferase involved in cellulose biosynthesis